jgi:hypothetical protein
VVYEENGWSKQNLLILALALPHMQNNERQGRLGDTRRGKNQRRSARHDSLTGNSIISARIHTRADGRVELWGARSGVPFVYFLHKTGCQYTMSKGGQKDQKGKNTKGEEENEAYGRDER